MPDYDKDKVDEAVFALLYLGLHDADEHGARAWKGFDWDALDRLHAKRLIGDPRSKAKSVVLSATEVGACERAFRKLFGKAGYPVREVHSAWIDAVNAGDLACLLSLMAEDCLFFSPGREPVGRDGFSAGFLAAHKQARLRCISELEEVVVAGEVAYTWSRDSLIVAPRAGGDAMRLAGHRMTVYREQPDGRWLLARDAHTLSPVPEVRS